MLAVSLPSVLIPIVVSLGSISILKLVHLMSLVECPCFAGFLQKAIVDVGENGKRRPFRIAKPNLDPIIPKTIMMMIATITTPSSVTDFPGTCRQSNPTHSKSKIHLLANWLKKIQRGPDLIK